MHNHGAILQLNALIRVLDSKGIEARALQFDKSYDFMGQSLKAKYEISFKSARLYLKYIKEKGVGCTLYNYAKRRTLNEYKKLHRILGDYYSESPILDGVIIGSDEVFALHTGPTPVFFGHCLPTNHVFAYAGSCGPTTIEEVDRLHSRALVKSGLDGMDYVTVRDANTADIVETLTGIRPPIVVDPVLLYGYEDEIDALRVPINRKYLLVYAYDNRMNSPTEVEAIKLYARKHGLITVSPGFYHSWCDKCINVDPVELLGWFKYAAEVITDTFHGSVMSIITGSKFIVKTRESNHFKLYNLLDEYGLSERLLTDWENLASTMTPHIDYDSVRKEIEKRRSASMLELDKMIV